MHDLWISAKETSRRCPGAKSPALNESEHRIQSGQQEHKGSELSCHVSAWRSLADCEAPTQASLTEHAHYECWNCRKDERSPRQAPRWSARQVSSNLHPCTWTPCCSIERIQFWTLRVAGMQQTNHADSSHGELQMQPHTVNPQPEDVLADACSSCAFPHCESLPSKVQRSTHPAVAATM